jgi:hypothetical protein
LEELVIWEIPPSPSKGTLSLCTPFFNPPHFPILGEVRI